MFIFVERSQHFFKINKYLATMGDCNNNKSCLLYSVFSKCIYTIEKDDHKKLVAY